MRTVPIVPRIHGSFRRVRGGGSGQGGDSGGAEYGDGGTAGSAPVASSSFTLRAVSVVPVRTHAGREGTTRLARPFGDDFASDSGGGDDAVEHAGRHQARRRAALRVAGEEGDVATGPLVLDPE